MSATYSINLNSPTESTRKLSVESILSPLLNNTQKLIRPRDVRDAFLSTWSNSAFKITKVKNTNSEYIGLDSGNPNNRDIKNKILIGKRSIGGVDVMNNDLLNSDTDIFFYNTKNDTDNQSSTKLGILAGTESNADAPYIESFATASQFNLNIVNPSGGDISIKSDIGNVFLNNIPFPKVSETPDNGDVLEYEGIYPTGKLKWSKLDDTIDTNLGSTSSETNIYGSTVSLNNSPLEFINDRLVPEDIGGIKQGASFSAGSFNGQNWPLSEVLRELIYPYIEPVLEISAFNQDGFPYGDIGMATSSITITYSITTFSREPSEDLFDINIKKNGLTVSTIGTFSGLPGSQTFSSLDLTISPTSPTSSTSSSTFELLASNVIDGLTFSNLSESLFEFVSPFFIIVTDNELDNSDVFGGTLTASNFIDNYVNAQGPSDEFSKSLFPYIDEDTVIPISIEPSGSASHLYFAYPFNYPEITGVRSVSTGFISVESFTFSESSIALNSYTEEYRLYKSLEKVIVSSNLEKFELLFNDNFINKGFVASPRDIIDDWILLGSFLPSDSGFILSDNGNLDINTNSIRIHKMSLNGNDYSAIFTQFKVGTIFRIDESINYVVTSSNSSVDVFILNIEPIVGSTGSTASTNSIVQFELLTL
jgi:hypothetical protein